MMTKMEIWLRNQQKRYIFNVKLGQGNNHFVNKTWTITDPNSKGLAFTLSQNDQDAPSILDVAPFNFPWLNIAEGYTSEELLSIATQIMKGSFRVKKSFLGIPSIILSSSKGNHQVEGKVNIT